VIAAGLLTAGAPAEAFAQIDFEREPIHYGRSPANDPVTALQQQIDGGHATLESDNRHGYLSAVLKHLDIDPSSQVLVKSKTSFQLRKISPQRPRALYFNDQSYVGWVQRGDVIEVMTTDPQQGEVFYTLKQEKVDRPRFVRDRGQCLTCHAAPRTQGVPGGLVRSMFVDSRGQPKLGSGTFDIDHTSPFSERWGGWYVTGTHGAMRHMGNVVAERSNPDGTGTAVLFSTQILTTGRPTSKNVPRTNPPWGIDRDAGANVTDLAPLLNVDPYLTPHSDIVALMVLEHQVQMQNHLTRAGFECRSATHYDGIMNDALDRPADFVSESTERRIASVGDKLLKYLLFAEEFRLAAPVEGTSGFAREFASRGPRDSRGRSLRDFDLQTRLFKYPCSYMIYSSSFDQLPAGVKQYVTQRLNGILTGTDHSSEFAHLTAADRTAILEILNETKPDLWR